MAEEAFKRYKEEKRKELLEILKNNTEKTETRQNRLQVKKIIIYFKTDVPMGYNWQLRNEEEWSIRLTVDVWLFY